MTDFSRAKALLAAVYPDHRVHFSPTLVTRVVAALPADAQRSLIGEVFAEAGAPVALTADAGLVIDYWTVRATHTRHGVHRFTGVVPMVRVQVQSVHQDIATEIGIVYQGDHLCWTRAMAVDRMRRGLEALAERHEGTAYARACREALEKTTARVELTTPARYFGARFAAVAAEVHVDADGAPIAYRLEAGMATGESVIDFVSPAGTAIEPRRAWYEPTPFSGPKQLYSGWLRLAADGAPERLLVGVKPEAEAPAVISIDATFERTQPDPVWPSLLTAQAALRVAAIARKLGRSLPGVEDGIRDVLANIAIATLPWEDKP